MCLGFPLVVSPCLAVHAVGSTPLSARLELPPVDNQYWTDKGVLVVGRKKIVKKPELADAMNGIMAMDGMLRIQSKRKAAPLFNMRAHVYFRGARMNSLFPIILTAADSLSCTRKPPCKDTMR